MSSDAFNRWWGASKYCQVALGEHRQIALDAWEAALSVAQGQGWLPIESAPRDGTVVVVFSPADGVNSSHYEGGMWQSLPWRGSRHPDFERAKPTHWQPLPAAPVQPNGVES